jgi:hypothetical protein
MTENCKFRKAILSAFYNISQRNFGILLILWCSSCYDGILSRLVEIKILVNWGMVHYNSNTVVKQDFAVVKQVDGRHTWPTQLGTRAGRAPPPPTRSCWIHPWLLPEKYKGNFDVSSEGPSSGRPSFVVSLSIRGFPYPYLIITTNVPVLTWQDC